METRHENPGSRRVLLGTTHGMIEGELAIGPELRTLDYLNRGSTRFLSLKAARMLSARPSLQGDGVHVNIDTILWVAEVDAMRRAWRPTPKAPLNRSGVRFCFTDCEILGFLHTPVQGDPFARLNQERSPFLAVTSASIVGSDTEMAAAFLAVNSQQVFTVEMIADDDAAAAGVPAFEEAEA